MPGLIGLQTHLPRGVAELQLKRMIEALQHEHFYVTGTWIDEAMGLYVGSVIRKGSFSEMMPCRNDRGNLTLIFCGEDYSDLGLHRYLNRVNNLAAPTYLVELAETDPGFPVCLNGRFHGLVADRARGVATLFNDRYGMQRLYYHQANEAFYFAAEAKAILAVRPELRRVDERALGQFITCGCVMENRTLFGGISVLPGASKWVLRDGSVERKGSYFHPKEWEEQDVLEPEKYYRQLRDVFSERLPRYFHTREPIGISLTGGLDTRMILAWHKPAPRSLACYTFRGTYRDCQDVVVGRKVARTSEQDHEVIEVGREFLSHFQRYAERTIYLTDGCADVRRASDLYLNERVRQIAPVRMTGNYGSEVLRGVRAFKPDRLLPGLFAPELNDYFQQAEGTYEALLEGHPVSFAVFKQAPWHHYGLLALEETQVSVRSPFLDNDLVRTVFQAPHLTFKGNDICLRLIEDGSPSLRRIPTDRGVGRAGPVGSVFRKWEEFLVKAEYAYDYGMPHWLARIDHVLTPFHVERLFLGRHKFNHYRVWYRAHLKNYVGGVLLDQKSLSRPYIEKQMVERVVQGHIRGDHNYTNEIHALLTLELLHRLFIDAR
jgi:asparagine synthase (glutamine-hydrolysing)